MRKNYLIYLLLVFCLSSSCRLAQKSMSTAAIEPKTPQFLFQQLNDSAFKCDWFTGKLTATVDFQKKVTTFTANIRMKRDSVIWVSISALGIEVVRVLITRDSLKLMDKLGAKYKVTDYEYLDGILQLSTSFELVQDLVLGNYFDYVEIEKLSSSRIIKYNYVLEALSKRKTRTGLTGELVTEELWMDPFSYKINKMFVNDSKSKRELSILYNDFRRLDRQMFPYRTEFVRNTKDPIKVNLEYIKVTVNKPQNFPFVIPEGYQMIR
jgi:hypothetical protein